MTSINTNVAAMTALQTLQATNNAMEDTQNRISTGYRVSEASDNAAYWSIATTMRSDNKALSAVVDALGIGSATVDTAYTAMESTKDLLNEIKAKLTTATGENVEKSKVQGEIKALQETIKSIAGSASFSGQNFLSVTSTSSQSVIGSFARDANGTISLGSIKINTSNTALFNSSATQYGMLETGAALVATNQVFDNVLATGKALVGAQTGTAATATVKATTTFANAFGSTATTFNDEALRFTATVVDNGVTTKSTVTIDKSVVNAALGSSDGKISNDADYAKVFNQALKNAGITDYVMATDGKTVNGKAAGFNVGDKLDISATSSVNNGNFLDVANFDITGADRSKIDTYLKDLDKVISKVVSGAATLGASKNQIDMQKDFTSKLMDTLEKGIGTLVDADMTEESTRLKALQTQQQLGVQALSMANSTSQNLMSLFR